MREYREYDVAGELDNTYIVSDVNGKERVDAIVCWDDLVPVEPQAQNV